MKNFAKNAYSSVGQPSYEYEYEPEGEEHEIAIDDQYDSYDQGYARPPQPPKKKKKKKAPAHAAAADVGPSPTAFAPVELEANVPAAETKKPYLSSMTAYFNEKKDRITGALSGSSAEVDPENVDEFTARELALKRKEAELAAKEKKIAEHEAEMKKYDVKIPNWPIRRWAILYHNIGDDILPENQRFVKSFYGLWLLELVCFGWQFLAMCVDLLDGACSAGVLSIVWNALFCCAGLFGSWFLWYKVIYDSSKKAAISSVKYGRFTCGFFMHWAWTIVMFSGVWASDGVISLLQTISGGCNASLIFFLVGTGLWGVNLLWSSWMSKEAYARYKKAGGSFSAMKADLTKEAARSVIAG